LKPFGIADFTGSAVLQGACGSRLQQRSLRLAAPVNSTIAQLRYQQFCVTFLKRMGKVWDVMKGVLNRGEYHPA